MMTVTNLALYRLLVQLGAPEAAASEAASMDATGLVTKADLLAAVGDLKAEIAEVRTSLTREIAEVRTSLKAEIADLRASLKGEIADLRTEMAAFKTSQRWVVVLLTLMLGATIAAAGRVLSAW